ncbi:hypothetical protein D8M04_05905 [Oceanobacillus piezotolerans]|uniref:Uncharacterized protein n=1 Tax=Oceanobacillus piezotolerans TaxID=2448030 RepID=A0A498DCN7_9BACI|nr:hypothetical protein [Oceanobacillus piezotolerans]RLL46737.1 hypothetical protein D8M04_05905 [Oceanobacillus piezotolerans]
MAISQEEKPIATEDVKRSKKVSGGCGCRRKKLNNSSLENIQEFPSIMQGFLRLKGTSALWSNVNKRFLLFI